MASDLQLLVDALADRLQRTITIDDKDWHVEAYSAVHGDVDDVRRQAILRRDATDEVKAWAAQLGLDEATAPTHTPANPALGAAPRVVFPLRHGGVLLGYLTLLDQGEDVCDDELAIAERAAAEAVGIKFREVLLSGTMRERERALLRDLLGDDPAASDAAATVLLDDELFVPRAAIAMMVLRIGPDTDRLRAGGNQRLFDHAVERARRRNLAGSVLGIIRHDHAVVLVAADDPVGLANVARVLRESVDAATAVVGIGGRVERLDAARSSHCQALRAAAVAARVPAFEGVASWATLGGYRMLSGLDVASDVSDYLNEGFLELLRSDRAGALCQTLEMYLDLGGDVKLTAEQLNLHRAGLYYRLDRIREITGMALRDGQVRLELHLSLKLARLAGLWPADAPGDHRSA